MGCSKRVRTGCPHPFHGGGIIKIQRFKFSSVFGIIIYYVQNPDRQGEFNEI